MNDGLLDKLKDYSKSDFYPFHMPGHKRNFKKGALAEAYRYDITEIDGFDNLHQPMSLIKKAQAVSVRGNLFFNKWKYSRDFKRDFSGCRWGA